MRVDQHRHHSLAGEINARGARRHAHVGRLADLGDAGAIHDQCGVLDHASVADDQPRAFERSDGLGGRRDHASGKDTKGNECRNGNHIHSVHGSLHHEVCALTPGAHHYTWLSHPLLSLAPLDGLIGGHGIEACVPPLVARPEGCAAGRAQTVRQGQDFLRVHQPVPATVR